MELPLQRFDTYHQVLLLHPVSILVLMELPLQRLNQIMTVSGGRVSILVLMELPLQPMPILLYRHHLLRFNPCFNGTTSATKN